MILKKHSRQKKIILFENDEELRSSLSRLLEREGFLVKKCIDENELLKLIDKNKFTAIIFGLNYPYPKDESIKILSHLPAHKIKPKIIVLSSFNMSELQNNFDLFSPQNFLTKPIKKETILTRLANIQAA
jgi:DNA-binding response OmpR family regulator